MVFKSVEIPQKSVSYAFYVDYLNKLTLVFNVEKTAEGLKKIKNMTIDKDTLYYYHVPSKDLRFPEFFRDRYIYLKFLYVFPSSASDLGSHWQPLKGFEQSDHSVLFEFCVLDMRYKLEDVKSGTHLRILRDTIMDNRFFDHIPQINGLSHYDNRIISHTQIKVKYELNPDANNWSKFNLYHERWNNPLYEVMKGSNKEHDFFCD